MTRIEEKVDVGPILADGTPFAELVDVEAREVSMRVLHDPEIFEIELDRLFGRAWVCVAHASEVPEAGNFVTRTIGADSVIVGRQSDGRILVMLNVCTHRGMQVCRADAGTTRRFRCPYHGWVFGQDGHLVGAPFENEMYSDGLEKEVRGLQQARVETFGGLVFANWSPTAPAFLEYLGDSKYYFEMMLDRTDDGLEVVGAPQRFIIPANWKTAAEQFAGDGYHAVTLHQSLQQLGSAKAIANTASTDVRRTVNQIGVDVSTPEGHGFRCFDKRFAFPHVLTDDLLSRPAIDRLRLLPPAGLTPEMVSQMERHLDAGQLEVLAAVPPSVGEFFPSSVFMSVYGRTAEGVGALALHTFNPVSADAFEMWHWTFVEKGAPEEFKRKTRVSTNFALGMSGVIEQDDAESWPAMQRSARGLMGRRHTLKYNSLLGVNKPEWWPGGGFVYAGYTKDDNQWNWWLRYREFMMGHLW